MELIIILAVVAVAGIIGSGTALWMLFRAKADGKRIDNAREEARVLISRAEDEKRKLIIDAQEEVLSIRTTNENDIKQQRQELSQLERRFLQREEQLQNKNDELDLERGNLADKQREMEQSLLEVAGLQSHQAEAFEKVSGLSV